MTQTTIPDHVSTPAGTLDDPHEKRLRLVLRLNATSSLLSGLVLAIAPNAIDDLLDTGRPGIVRLVSLALIPFAVGVAWLSTSRVDQLRRHTPEIIAGDVGWGRRQRRDDRHGLVLGRRSGRRRSDGRPRRHLGRAAVARLAAADVVACGTHMAALWIAHIDVTDEERYGAYVAQATGVISSHGGEFIARGGRYEQVEGRDHPRNVVVRFPTFEAASECYHSEAYQAIVGDAIAGSDRSVVIVETTD